ncbi:MAG: murein biosynthesis integral membrane protein MurJ [Candidatus Brocadiae bacterium]|nr:murein biosynthesis integral membrane protein MurJ [Candidatus Brocadiia bacterium]
MPPESPQDPPGTRAPAHPPHGVLSAARVVSACILLSRILGLVRDVCLASLFGGGIVNDAFVLATLVPNLFRRFFGEGALTAAFIPTYSQILTNRPREEADRFARSAMTWLALALGLLSGAGMAIAGVLSRTLADEKGRLVADLLVVLLPYMPLVCLVALVTGILNVHRHFLLPALASSILNLFEIAAFFVVGWFAATQKGQASVIAWSITLAGLGQLLLQLPALRTFKVPVAPLLRWEPGVRQVLAGMAPMTFGIAVIQVNVLVDNAIAEAMIPGDGAVSALYYANRLFNFPLALIGIAIAQAAFPEFSEAFARGKKDELAASLSRACRMVLFLAVPAAAGLIVMARPVIRLFFEHGSFTPVMTERSGAVLAFYGAGVWAACLQHVVVRAFFAARDLRTPAILGGLTVCANAALNLVLVRSMQEAGLALATSITATLQLIVLAVLLRRRLPEMSWAPVLRILPVSLAAAGAMAAACWGLLRVLPPHRAVQALVPVAAGAALYFLVARLLRVPEARDILAFRRRRSS